MNSISPVFNGKIETYNDSPQIFYSQEEDSPSNGIDRQNIKQLIPKTKLGNGKTTYNDDNTDEKIDVNGSRPGTINTMSHIGNKTPALPTTTTVKPLGTLTHHRVLGPNLLAKPADNKAMQFKDNNIKNTMKIQSNLLTLMKQEESFVNTSKNSLNISEYKELEANKIRNNLQYIEETGNKTGFGFFGKFFK